MPFFRDEDLKLLEEPFAASVVTSLAPNAAGALRTDDERARLRDTFVRRIEHVLSVFAAQGTLGSSSAPGAAAPATRRIARTPAATPGAR